MKKILLVVMAFCLVSGCFAAEKSKAAQRVMKFLEKNYGNHIISGQMDLTWHDGTDMAARVYKDTGTYPVLMGYDFMNYAPREGDGQQQVSEAFKWWSGLYDYDKDYKGHKGGLVAFCWHWRAGREKSFSTSGTTTRIPYEDGKINTESATWSALKKQMKTIADELEKLKKQGVPVLWRPLHEASGGWFWWGASGPEPYKALWIYMYDYMTNERGLDNLIWVWNGQKGDWYPGDEYVDIIGEDIYGATNGSQIAKYNAAKAYTDGGKMITLSETGRIPDPDKCAEDGAWWSYFMVWNDATTGGSTFTKDDFWSSEKVNSLEFRKKVYSHDLVLTLDEIQKGDF